ncbi:MAG: YraN family protein [Actinobacteria bacterium]|nr:MAG: YraN family protein [Actinomycetota bacterium]
MTNSRSNSNQPRPATNQANRSRGRWGEDLAATLYRRQGYEILDRNWRSKTGELDLVLRQQETIVFSEVKARRNDDFGPASAAVGIAKQRRIRQLAVEWLRANGIGADSIRFDVVAITGVEVELIEDAF